MGLGLIVRDWLQKDQRRKFVAWKRDTDYSWLVRPSNIMVFPAQVLSLIHDIGKERLIYVTDMERVGMWELKSLQWKKQDLVGDDDLRLLQMFLF